MRTVKIKGMSCQHCVNAVSSALSSLEGVKNVQVSLEKGEASFEEEKPIDLEAIKKVVKEAGYEVQV